ncbi:MAG: hypothetical protein GX541_00340 [Clostridiales bacterium]|nr:hypothetical protein [Clostridiales bacterium]
MTERENMLRVIRFERPDYIPMKFCINNACWQNYPQEFLFEQMEAHKFLFPDFKRPEGKYVPEFHSVGRKDEPFVDDWGCTWETAENGITGTVTKHPLAEWAAFENYKAPDPGVCMGIGPVDWDEEKKKIELEKAQGKAINRGLRHGHTFLQLCDMRGYENLMFDMVDEEPRLDKLIEMIEEFNMYIVNKYIELGADIITYAEDLGMQHGPMLSPAHFRRYIQPSYMRLMKPAQDKGLIVHMHSDGDLRVLLDDMLECKINIINLQDLVNGIDWIAEKLAGRYCIELDIDRQFVTAGGTPKQVDDLIREEVSKIGRKEGGLMMIYGLYPGIPLENIKALMDAMEKYAFYYS